MLSHVAIISQKLNLFIFHFYLFIYCNLVTMLSEFRIGRIEIWILFEHAVALCNLMYTDIMTSHSKRASFRSECVQLLYVYMKF
jgi:hypothetical protein